MFGSNNNSGGFGPGKDQMDPADMRNLIIFFVLAAVFYFAYETYILKPQRVAMQQQKQIEALQAVDFAKETPQEVMERAEVLEQSPRITFANDNIYGSINLIGGRIDDVSLSQYKVELDSDNDVVLLSPRRTDEPRLAEFGWVSGDKSLELPDSDTRWQVRGNEMLRPGSPVTLIWDSPQGLRFEREIALDEQYLFTVTQRVINNSGREVTLYPYGLVSQTGLREGMADTWLAHEGPIGYIGDALYEIDYKELRGGEARSMQAVRGWAGLTDKYWLTALLPTPDQGAQYRFSYDGPAKPENVREEGRYQIDYTGPAAKLAPGASGENISRLYAGAKEVLVLEDYSEALGAPRLDLAVNFGWFWFLSKPFFYALHFLNEHIGNMGLAIILLTIAIRSSVFPLTNTSYKSFAKMKKVSPQIMELRKSYGEDKQKLQEELVKLYQREGVNPMAGCFPILLQIPIFFALYKVLYVTIEMRHAPFFGWIEDLSARDPTSIFNLFGLLPWDPPSMLMIGIWPCLMCILMIIQKKLNPPPQDKLQRDLMNYFPFIITIVMAGFAAGLVIYWTFSALIGVIQQIIIMKRMGVPVHLFGESEEEEAMDKAVEQGPDVHPQAEMVEDEVEKAMFGEDDSFPKADGDKPKKITPPKPKKSKKKK